MSCKEADDELKAKKPEGQRPEVAKKRLLLWTVPHTITISMNALEVMRKFR